MVYRYARRSFGLGAVAALCIAACAKSGNTPPSDPMSTGDGAGGSGSGATDGAAALDTSFSIVGDGPVFVTPDVGGGRDACQELAVNFVPKIPLVFVLADQSGSMFDPLTTADGGTTNRWKPLREATLAVITSLYTRVAFGFGAYTGINPNTTPGMCPIVPNVPVGLGVDTYTKIVNLYTSLPDPAQTFKRETPAQKSLELVSQWLAQAAASQADAGQGDGGIGQPGGKYILFVTDGETDFCDDGNAVCPADAAIAELEKLHGEGIETIVLAIGSNVSNISGPVLQSFANAGAGVLPLAPPGNAAGPPLLPADIYNQCNGVSGWNQLWTAAGLTSGQALGTYAPSGAAVANALLYSPDATNVTDLTNKIAAALNTVKSCSFDLQGKIKVDLPHAASGKVSVDGVAIPYDATNGWTMTTPTQLDLVGTSCQAWRASGTKIDFAFPCEIIISVAQ